MFQLIYRKFGNRLQTKDDLLSGLTVALALVPEAVAFAIIAGVTPIIGLYAAFMVCLITAVLGGRPGMISGATGALAVIMVSLVLLGNERGEALGLGPDMGTQYLFAAVILMGIIQIGCGILKLGRFVRLIPQPVMFGFVNGLAIVIFEAQFPMFTESPTTPGSAWLQGGGPSIDGRINRPDHGDHFFTSQIHHPIPLLSRSNWYGQSPGYWTGPRHIGGKGYGIHWG